MASSPPFASLFRRRSYWQARLLILLSSFGPLGGPADHTRANSFARFAAKGARTRAVGLGPASGAAPLQVPLRRLAKSNRPTAFAWRLAGALTEELPRSLAPPSSSRAAIGRTVIKRQMVVSLGRARGRLASGAANSKYKIGGRQFQLDPLGQFCSLQLQAGDEEPQRRRQTVIAGGNLNSRRAKVIANNKWAASGEKQRYSSSSASLTPRHIPNAPNVHERKSKQ